MEAKIPGEFILETLVKLLAEQEGVNVEVKIKRKDEEGTERAAGSE